MTIILLYDIDKLIVMKDFSRFLPTSYLITIGAISLTTAVVTAIVKEDKTVEPFQPNDEELGQVTVDGSCPYHNPYQAPFITGSHPDITIHIPESSINREEGVTTVFTDLSNGIRIIGAQNIPADNQQTIDIRYHNYIRGTRPNGYTPTSDIPLNGQRIRMDIIEGTIIEEQIISAPVKETVLFQAPICTEQTIP